MRLIFGVGINDADYVTEPTINGKRTICPIFMVWRGMIERCYSNSFQKRHQTYIGCYVVKEWLRFSKFSAWMKAQDWQGKELDKDLILTGNKIYCPEYCCFVDSMTNSFTISCAANRGEYLVGVNWHKKMAKFRAQCRNPFTKKREHLGYYDNEKDAHFAWLQRKREIACHLAEKQKDPRVAKALRNYYPLPQVV